MKPTSWIHVGLGAWLIAAPFVLGYVSHSARSEDVILGVVVICVALWEGQTPGVPAGALAAQLMLAAWIFCAPFAMAYVGTFPALINDIVVSALLVITSVTLMTFRPVPGEHPLQAP